MIEQQCALPDANEIEQHLVESGGSEKVTATEVQRLLQEEFSSAGLQPNVTNVTVTDRFFAEVTLRNAPKVWLAEEILDEQVGALGKRGISLTYCVRPLWTVNSVHFRAVGRSASGEFMNVLRFQAQLRSGEARSEVEVRVDARALARLLKRLGLEGHTKHSSNGRQPDTITQVIEELLARDLDEAGHWDPIRFPQWELGEPEMASLLRRVPSFAAEHIVSRSDKAVSETEHPRKKYSAQKTGELLKLMFYVP